MQHITHCPAAGGLHAQVVIGRHHQPTESSSSMFPCRCVIPTRPSVASHLARGRTSSAMAVSKDAAAAPGSRPPKRRTTSRSDNQLEQQHHSDLRAANGRAAVATQQPPNSQHDPARSASQSGVSAASPQRPPTLGQDSHGDSNGLIQQHGSDSQPSAVEQRAKGGLLTNSLGPRPRPRRSTSKSMSAVDDKAHGVAASTATKPGAGANNDAAGVAGRQQRQNKGLEVVLACCIASIVFRSA